jgi:putative Ca2+/H+ antiporter (TMEM165/GDT1 family)
MAEWGDKTQIAAAMFATKYDAWMVLLGCMTALTLLSVMAIYLGKFILDKVNPKLMTKIAGAVFILTGMSFFLA